MRTKTAGVVIDTWKLPTFKKVLDAAGYTYTEQTGPTKDTTTLTVKYDWVSNLKPVVEAAVKECRTIQENTNGHQ